MNKKFFVNQENINDCGAASLTMILNLFDKKVSLKEIKEKLMIKKEGVSAYDIVKLSDKYGIKAEGYKNCVIEKVTSPAIVHVINENNLQHFMVLLKVLNDKVLVADPASSIRFISKQEFNNIYTGIVIMFKNKIHKNNIKFEKALAIKTIILTLLLSFISIICSFLFSNTLKSFNNYNNVNYIYRMLFLFFFISFLKEIVTFARQRIALNFEVDVDKKTTIKILKNLINLPHEFYSQTGSGELISKINDISYIKLMIYTLVEELSINAMFILFSLVVLFIINKIIFLISILIITIIFIINKLFFKRHFSSIYELQMKNEILNGKIGDCINGITTIKNLGKEKFFNDGFEKFYKEYLGKNKILNLSYQKKSILINIISLIFKVLIFIILVNLKENIYKFIFIISLIDIIINSSLVLCDSSMLYANFKSAFSRLKSLNHNIEYDLSNKVNIKNISFRNFIISINGLSITKPINFNIKKGDWILVYGKAGIGKTTLFKILTKQLLCNSEKIYINGIKLDKFSNETIRRCITYVDQKAKLFNKTIGENIYFERTTLDWRIENYLKIWKLDKNYLIDNSNSNISGGQMQKVIIAQALLNGGDMIIFDETTNQIDEVEEREILTFIKKYYKDKTIVLINHRKGNETLFDKILTFENKRVKVKTRRNINDKIN